MASRRGYVNGVRDSAGRIDDVQNKDPIVPTHPDYEAQLDDWYLMSDLTAGTARVKSKTDKYLIPTELERSDGLTSARGKKSRYTQRLERSPYMNYSKRLKRYAMANLFREKVILPEESTLPEALKPLLKNADMLGTKLEKFFQMAGDRAYEMGHYFILVDMPDEEIESLADELEKKPRPYFTLIDPRDVVNWQITRGPSGTMSLDWVNIRSFELKSGDAFSQPEYKEYYTVWTKEGWTKYEIGGTSTKRSPKTGTKTEITFQEVASGAHPCKRVPLVTIYSEMLRPMMSVPPLLEAAQLSLDHYNITSMYVNGLMYHLNPLLTFSGVSSEEQVKRGANYAVYLPQAAEAKYVEFQGNALSIAKETTDNISMEVMESGLRNTTSLGANTSAEARRLARSDFNSFHEGVAENFDTGFREAFEVAALWTGEPLPDDLVIKMNSDFDVTVMDAAMAEFLLRARQAGEISRKRLFKEMMRGEVFSNELNVEDEIKDAEKDGPSEVAQTAAQLEKGAGATSGQGPKQPRNPNRVKSEPSK